jgi:hypothetical protein
MNNDTLPDSEIQCKLVHRQPFNGSLETEQGKLAAMLPFVPFYYAEIFELKSLIKLQIQDLKSTENMKSDSIETHYMEIERK